MKNTGKVLAVIAAFVLALQPTGYAALDPGQAAADVTASVGAVLELNMAIKEQIGGTEAAPLFGGLVGSMAHGTLVSTGVDSQGRPFALSGKSFHVWLNVNTSSRAWTLSQTMPPMKNGNNIELPHAMVFKPIQARRLVSSNPDVWAVADGSFLVPVTNQDPFSVTAVDIFQSASPHRSAEIELVYGISGGNEDGTTPFADWEPIPPDQADGSYATTVLYTVTV